ncbi:hypothetical protein QEH59_16150 [Coraliomargarita sp. SDUM461004]|uniref:Uncharacterized protein n=1 Tax=Thalassobacterium sedimentorum TaxID=3041258 RepID=A0ABU1AQT3_9BACT|nr:hypothetical protein [Coraliomargarita sp. SDUM461004]MDQ8195968.1 hypothetical protein [Coraliomargarita sp. SDUM461004]
MSTVPSSLVDNRLHDLTLVSQGIQTNTLQEDLKTVLSLAFELSETDFDLTEMRRVPIKMAYMDDATQWRVFYSSKWTVLGKKRAFIIIYCDERSGKLRARGVNSSS